MTTDTEPTEPNQASTDQIPRPPTRRRRRNLLILAAVYATVALVGVTVGVALFADDGGDQTAGAADNVDTFQAAVDQCAAHSGAQVGDGGKTLLVNGEGEEDTSGIPVTTLACLLGELDTPDAVVEQMDTTRALDGRQEASWGKYHASWTYHPDDGLDIIVTVR